MNKIVKGMVPWDIEHWGQLQDELKALLAHDLGAAGAMGYVPSISTEELPMHWLQEAPEEYRGKRFILSGRQDVRREFRGKTWYDLFKMLKQMMDTADVGDHQFVEKFGLSDRDEYWVHLGS